MRWLIILTALLGIVTGLAWPTSDSRAGTGYWFQAAMAPPSGSTGQSVPLNCGWHTGACDDPDEDGPNLDWDDLGGGSFTVYFRGWFARDNTQHTSNYLQAHIFQYIEGSNVCDHLVTDVIEVYSWTIRYGMHYLHANTNYDDTYFGIYTESPPGAWDSVSVGYTVYDAGGCSWTGYHVHEFAAYVDVNATAKNEELPTGDYCNPGDSPPCETYQNNATWTNWTNWEEGSSY